MHIIQVETGELVVAAEDYSICCSIEGEDMEKLKEALKVDCEDTE